MVESMGYKAIDKKGNDKQMEKNRLDKENGT